MAATVMKGQGLSEGVIGIITSGVYVGVLAMAPFQPWLARRFGSVVTYQCGKMLSALGFAGSGQFSDPYRDGHANPQRHHKRDRRAGHCDLVRRHRYHAQGTHHQGRHHKNTRLRQQVQSGGQTETQQPDQPGPAAA